MGKGKDHSADLVFSEKLGLCISVEGDRGKVAGGLEKVSNSHCGECSAVSEWTRRLDGQCESPFEVVDDDAMVTLIFSILWLYPAVFGSCRAGTEKIDN